MSSSERTPSSHGFLGSTSFAAVYLEDQHLKSLHDTPVKPSGNQDLWAQSFFGPGRDSQVRKGAECLSLLQEFPFFEVLLERWLSHVTISIALPWIPACLSSIKAGICNDLAQSTNEEVANILLIHSAKIFENSLKPLDLRRDCTMDQFSNLITGQNLRWESVGMFFGAVGLAAVTIDDTAAVRSEHYSLEFRRGLARQMLEATDTCISICEDIGQLTDPESWLYCENTHLSTVVDGDASYSSWRRTGNLISMCIAKGLHREMTVSSEVPFWMSEIRKRTFAIAYTFDKELSSFLGRPPRLPRRYCAMELPLDLDVEQLRMPEPQLNNEINKLDQDGWNTDGKFGGPVYIRAALLRHMITEDILELTLSSLEKDGVSFAEDILRRSQTLWNSLPAFITSGKREHGSGAEPHILEMMRLEFRHSTFQLQRAMVQRFHTSIEELISISREMLSTVIVMLHRHDAGAYAYDMPWLIAKHAVPTAGVLALQLLLQSQGYPVAASFHKSEVVQNLSSLVAALKWVVTKQAVNYEICAHARPVLQRILDLVLDPEATYTGLQSNPTSAPVYETPNYGNPWLDEVKSETEFWALLPQHPLLADFPG